MANAKDRIENAKPYVQRAIQDEELRDNLRSAFATARDVYDELIGNRGVTGVATKVASDKDIQDQLRSAIERPAGRRRPGPGQPGPQGPQQLAAARGHRARPPLQPADRP